MVMDKRLLNELNNNYSLVFDKLTFNRDGGSLSYIVYTNSRRYFLKMVRPEFLDTARQSIDIHLYLYHNHFAVPQIILTKPGTPYFSRQHDNGTHLYILYEYIEGLEPDIYKDAEGIGRFIGNFTVLCKNIAVIWCPGVNPILLTDIYRY
ncbi:hypothetical protein C2I18_25860 [Paenibacillus sp. PK3_47]|nr:hypothetical protein C2I18_25860 [Paenibacillus sp. PK3_47]